MRPTGQNKDRVRTYLERHGRANDKQVGKFIAMSRSTAYRYLSELCDDGIAHRTFDRDVKGNKLVIFNIGPQPDVPMFDVRVVVKAWAPMQIVDPWMLPKEFFKSGGVCV